MSETLTPKPIRPEMILERFRKTAEQKRYAFPTEYGSDRPRMGFDRMRYSIEQRELSREEKWKEYFAS